jgi:hypothetical protein
MRCPFGSHSCHQTLLRCLASLQSTHFHLTLSQALSWVFVSPNRVTTPGGQGIWKSSSVLHIPICKMVWCKVRAQKIFVGWMNEMNKWMGLSLACVPFLYFSWRENFPKLKRNAVPGCENVAITLESLLLSCYLPWLFRESRGKGPVSLELLLWSDNGFRTTFSLLPAINARLCSGCYLPGTEARYPLNSCWLELFVP